MTFTQLFPIQSSFSNRARTRTAFFMVALIASLFSASAQAQQMPDLPTVEQLAEYQGSYEGRDVQLDGSTLTYYRAGMQRSIDLVLIATDHFAIDIPPGAVVQSADGHAIPSFRFVRDEDGNVTTLEIVQPDGTVSARHPRTKELMSVQDQAKAQ